MDGSEDDALWLESDEDSDDPFTNIDSESEHEDFDATESQDSDSYLTDGDK